MNKSTKLYDFCVLELFNSLLITTTTWSLLYVQTNRCSKQWRRKFDRL